MADPTIASLQAQVDALTLAVRALGSHVLIGDRLPIEGYTHWHTPPVPVPVVQAPGAADPPPVPSSPPAGSSTTGGNSSAQASAGNESTPATVASASVTGIGSIGASATRMTPQPGVTPASSSTSSPMEVSVKEPSTSSAPDSPPPATPGQ